MVDKAKEESRKSFRGHSQFESQNPLSCYGCGKPGYIKSKCPDCNPSKGDPAHFGILRINSLSPSNRNAVLKISIEFQELHLWTMVEVIRLQEKLFTPSFSNNKLLLRRQ
ncbi:hypothetical protein TNCV_530491 [Trichonephila clavipes]|nr:hypothetical protein TNCV_530491 [Trichonephila clavipes]